MEEHEREFMAYNRKLLRRLQEIVSAIDRQHLREAKSLLTELMAETKSDINDDNHYS